MSRETWGDTVLRLEGVEAGRYREVFTGREFDARDGALHIGEILSPLPVALLSKV